MTKARGLIRRRVTRRTLIKAGAGSLAGAIAGSHSFGVVFAETPDQSQSAEGDPAPESADFAALAVSTPPILVVVGSAAGNPFTGYLDEILRAEGVRDYEVRSLGDLNAALLGGRRVVILGECAPSSAQIADLQNYVNLGGGLVAMTPVDGLAGMLGITSQGNTYSNAYFRITDGSIGGGLYSDTMQFKGTANRYALNGATQVAQVYSNRTDGTSHVASSIANYGSGRAAMFAFDVARSVVLMRQGDPAKANVDTDGDGVLRTIDLYNGWVDLERSAVPQSDMLQRLLVRVIEAVTAQPLPRFWYFPGTRRSVLIPTADAHANPESYYQALVNDFGQRGIGLTFYMTTSGLSNGTVQAWRGQGFDFATHPYVDGGHANGFAASLGDFQNDYGFTPRTARTHQVRWTGWDQAASIEAQYAVEMDFNMYQWGAWLNKPGGIYHGYMTGSGLPMRFVTASGVVLPIYQQHTTLVDETLAPEVGIAHLDEATAIAISRQTIDESVDGYHTAIATQYHVDYYSWGGVNAWVLATTDYAMQRGLQVLHADAWLTFTKQRASSGVSGSVWSGGALSFAVSSGGGAQTVLVPLQFRGSNLTQVRINGSPANYETMSINGVNYAALAATNGNWQASYNTDTTPPLISGVTAQNISPNGAQIVWTTDEASTSVVNYGVGGALDQQASSPGLTTNHVVNLSGLTASTQYSYQVTSVDGIGNSASSAVATFSSASAAALALTSVSPASGMNDAARPISLTGANFVSGATVRLGTTNLSPVQFVGSTTLQTTVPSGFVPGAHDVTVTNPDGSTATLPAAYSVTAPPASLSGVSPATVSAGAQFNLTGTGFAAGATVWLGSTVISSSVLSSTSATAIVPTGTSPGVYDVVIANPGGQASTLPGALTVTALLSISHTTLADFSAGTFTSTQALAGGGAGDGAVTLASTGFGDEFNGTSLDAANWATGLWDGAGSVIVSGGSCTIRGGWIRSLATTGNGAVTARLTFPNSAWQNFGLSRTDTIDDPWLLFGVPGWDTSRVYARINVGSTNAEIPLTGLTGAPHDYTLEYSGTQVRFLVDGALVHQANIPNAGALATWLSVGVVGAPLIADSVSSPAYAASGTFLSAALDTGQSVDWAQISIPSTLPAGTTARIRARSSAAGLTYSGWTPWSSASPADLAVPDGRYLQYELELTSNSSAVTPLVGSVTATYQGSAGPGVATVTVNPSSSTISAGGAQQFAATMLDAQGQPVPGASASWSVVNGGGSISQSGLFTAGSTAGSFPNTVAATSQGVSGSASVTVNALAPTISSVSPSTGPTTGGTTVTIAGTNFQSGATVRFGANLATNVTVTATSIGAQTPAGSSGSVDVSVTNPDGGTVTRISGFQYATAPVVPTVTGVAPASGPTIGGNSVVVSGTGFSGTTQVAFGTTNAPTFTVVSSTQISVVAPARSSGTINVRVTTASGTSAATTPSQYTYNPTPSISSVSPSSGPTSGGTNVNVNGANFQQGATVQFGGNQATVVLTTSSTITVTSPAGAAGAVNVVVTNPDSGAATRTNGFTYLLPAPAVTAVSPNSGPTSGGNSIVITGTNFTGATTVRFGLTNATSFVLNSATQITAVAPARSSGTVNVRVTTPGGTSPATSPSDYTFVAAPSISSVSPTSGPTAGGTAVTINGARFSGATVVRFGSVNATSFSVVSASQITAVSPPGAAGRIDIRVTAIGGTSSVVNSDRFTYQ